MNFLERVHCEWWQALLLLIVLRMYPVFKAVATILVARFVKPDLAKLALPLILSSTRDLKKADPKKEGA
jgi:hypothetical protein